MRARKASIAAPISSVRSVRRSARGWPVARAAWLPNLLDIRALEKQSPLDGWRRDHASLLSHGPRHALDRDQRVGKVVPVARGQSLSRRSSYALPHTDNPHPVIHSVGDIQMTLR